MTNVLVYNVIDIDDLLLKVFVYIHDLHPVCSLISPRGHIFRNRNSDSCGQHLTTDELPASEEKLNTPFASVWDRERPSMMIRKRRIRDRSGKGDRCLGREL